MQVNFSSFKSFCSDSLTHDIWRQTTKDYPGKRPQTVCVRSISRKSRDLDALGSREMVVIKVWVRVRV